MGGLTATSLWQGTQACEVSSFAGRWRHPAPDQYIFIVQYFTMEQISSLPAGLPAENPKYDHESNHVKFVLADPQLSVLFLEASTPFAVEKETSPTALWQHIPQIQVNVLICSVPSSLCCWRTEYIYIYTHRYLSEFTYFCFPRMSTWSGPVNLAMYPQWTKGAKLADWLKKLHLYAHGQHMQHLLALFPSSFRFLSWILCPRAKQRSGWTEGFHRFWQAAKTEKITRRNHSFHLQIQEKEQVCVGRDHCVLYEC